MKYKIGLRVNGKVNNITKTGIFVTLDKKHHGLIYYKEFGNDWKNIQAKYEKGQELRVVVINNKDGKLALSLKQVNNPDLVDPTNQFNHQENFSKTLEEVINEADKKISSLQKS
ncbi:S1 RNA-binding domain-containing protein [Lactobacillus sp. PV037]|uniref:S1 RNA-binding domain-containing protein n=1 Tax=unclassified Lactobacillus TaxID=2620435 RepID=UPI00223F2747|nr:MULTISPECIES: S1 RNA-binding domain-containing protein [unclassified Lactobacillus]QNQ81799.1 S1 RNA-binding domain-containing protein [Lactobacillus sp. PV012]QNQ84158.1 S1 RNA-binding domain-containing protein [Lactobacillus sp. PV037]